MICKLCGKENPDGTAFCDGCGCSFETGEGKIEEVMAAGETPESDKVPDAEAETAAAEEAPAGQ